MTVLTFRAELAAGLTPLLDPVPFYDFPAETVVLPSVVFTPRDPYWRPQRITEAGEGVTIDFDLSVCVPRTVELETAFAELEGLALALAQATATLGFRWVDLSVPEPIEINKLPAVTARMGFTRTVH